MNREKQVGDKNTEMVGCELENGDQLIRSEPLNNDLSTSKERKSDWNVAEMDSAILSPDDRKKLDITGAGSTSDEAEGHPTDKDSLSFQRLSLRETKQVNGEKTEAWEEDKQTREKKRRVINNPPITHNLLQSYIFNKYKTQGYKHDFQPSMVHADPIDRRTRRFDVEEGQFEDAE